MNIWTLILILALPLTAWAQQGMSEEQMQAMMQQMQKAQQCMEQVDQEQLKKLEARTSRMEAEIKKLCQAGKRDEAEAKAMAFGKEMAKDPTVKQYQRCAELMQGMAQQMPFANPEHETSERHVCDE